MTEQAAIGWIFTVVGAGVLWLICGLVVGYFIGGASKMAGPRNGRIEKGGDPPMRAKPEPSLPPPEVRRA
jgi:hypothetical protein